MTSPPAPDPTPTASASGLAPTSVPTAFSIGWLLGDLRAWAAAGCAAQAAFDPPSQLMLEPSPRVKIDQIASKLSQLGPDLLNAGLEQKDITPLTTWIGDVRETITAQALKPDDVDRLLQRVSDVLTAASTRVGQALGLGFDLANTCRMRPEVAKESPEKAFLELFGARLVRVQAALADLASALPQHAARSVSLSLAQWQYWAGELKLNKEPVTWPHPGVEEALTRQGEVWRTVLSGEKLGQDMLSADDYLDAVKELVKTQLRKRPWIWLALLLSVALVGAGIYVATAQTATVTKLIGVVLPVLGAVGISTASLRSLAAGIAKEIQTEVWGAELDFAIAEAVTVPPGEWRVKLRKIDTPPPRGLDRHIATNARVVRKVSKIVRTPADRRRWVRERRLRSYIDEKCTLTRLTGDNVNARLAKHLIERHSPIGNKPQHIAPGAPGRLWSLHHDANGSGNGNGNGKTGEHFVVWTFRQNDRAWLPWRPSLRVIYLDECENSETARAEAHQPRVKRSPRAPQALPPDAAPSPQPEEQP